MPVLKPSTAADHETQQIHCLALAGNSVKEPSLAEQAANWRSDALTRLDQLLATGDVALPEAVVFDPDLDGLRDDPAFHDLLWHPAFVVPASQLLGGAVRFWHDQLFVKPAHDGGVVIWHQDYSYWTRTKPMAHLTCWIGLDDSTTENGCVHYVPRSHRWDLLPREDFANNELPSTLRGSFGLPSFPTPHGRH